MTRRGILSIIGPIFDPLGFVAPHKLRGKKMLQLSKMKLVGTKLRLMTLLENGSFDVRPCTV